MPLVPSYIKKLKSYKPGKPVSEATRETGITDIIKLASNENPLGPSKKAIAAIKYSLKNMHRYPDASGYELRAKLADQFKVKINSLTADFFMEKPFFKEKKIENVNKCIKKLKTILINSNKIKVKLIIVPLVDNASLKRHKINFFVQKISELKNIICILSFKYLKIFLIS